MELYLQLHSLGFPTANMDAKRPCPKGCVGSDRQAPWFWSCSWPRLICQIEDACWKQRMLRRAAICFPCPRAALLFATAWDRARWYLRSDPLWAYLHSRQETAGLARPRCLALRRRLLKMNSSSWPSPESRRARGLPQAACIQTDEPSGPGAACKGESHGVVCMSRMDLPGAVTARPPELQTSCPYHAAAPCDT